MCGHTHCMSGYIQSLCAKDPYCSGQSKMLAELDCTGLRRYTRLCDCAARHLVELYKCGSLQISWLSAHQDLCTVYLLGKPAVFFTADTCVYSLVGLFEHCDSKACTMSCDFPRTQQLRLHTKAVEKITRA